MSEKMKMFLEQLAKDEALLNQLKSSKSPEEAFAIASGAVNGLDKGEFEATMKKINEMVAAKGDGELSEDDLDMVAGGMSDEAQIAIAVIGAVGAAVGPAAAAAI